MRIAQDLQHLLLGLGTKLNTHITAGIVPGHTALQVIAVLPQRNQDRVQTQSVEFRLGFVDAAHDRLACPANLQHRHAQDHGNGDQKYDHH